MRPSLLRLFTLISLVVLTWGCAGLNEGVNEYRYGVPSHVDIDTRPLRPTCKKPDGNYTEPITVPAIWLGKDIEAPKIACEVQSLANVGIRLRSTTSNNMKVHLTATCPQSTIKFDRSVVNGKITEPISCIQQQQRKYNFSARYFHDEPQEKIEEGQSISIRMLQAYICDFREGLMVYETDPNACQGGDGEQGALTRGEVVVLANIFERGKKEGAINYSYANIKEQGRVIFYSEDVRETGQLLNFSNMPVYGPITYDGKPFYMEFNILELDNQEAAEMRSLLGTLAALGSAAYPPSSVALSVLDSLGGALLSGEQDDLELRYQMELDPPKVNSTDDHEHRAYVLPGIYAFVRQEKRNETADWENIDFDPKRGYLLNCANKKSTKDCPIYRGSTWFVLKISTGESSVDLDWEEKFSKFEEKNKKASEKNIAAIKNEINTLKQKLTKIKTGYDLDKGLDVLKDTEKFPPHSLQRVTAEIEIASALCEVHISKKDAALSMSDYYDLIEELTKLGVTNTELATISQKCNSDSGGSNRVLFEHLFPQSVLVPDVVGQSQSDAEATLTTTISTSGFTVGSITQQASDKVAAGMVISQEPTPGTNVAPGSAVNLVISMGSESVPVPDVVGQPQDAAETAITTAGFTVGSITKQANDKVAAGSVISQNPTARTVGPGLTFNLVVPGSAIDLVVSTGGDAG